MTVRLALVISIALLAAGCSTLFSKAKPVPTALVELEQQKSVYIAFPEDGNFAGVSYLGSGQAVMRTIADAFSRRGVPVQIAEARLTNVEAVATAARLKAGYAVLPLITWWEHRTERFGRLDRASIRITVVDVNTGDTVASRLVEGRSRILSLPAAHTPDALLANPLQLFVDGLYTIGGPPVPEESSPPVPQITS